MTLEEFLKQLDEEYEEFAKSKRGYQDIDSFKEALFSLVLEWKEGDA